MSTQHFVVGHSRAPRSVLVEVTPEGDDGSVSVSAPGYRVDAVHPDPFGGFRPYARGAVMFPGRPGCRTVDQAIQLALDD